MFVALSKKNIIMAVSEQPFNISGHTVIEIDFKSPKAEWHKLIGTKLKNSNKPHKDIRLAVVCNWNQCCGISTYSKYLVDALKPKVKELRVFAEITDKKEDFVHPCWQRGHSTKDLVKEILDWKPDFVMIQHEFGLFPKATYFLQLLQGIDDVPYVVTMHSVYKHLDKTVCSSAAKNIIVHSNEAKQTLKDVGNNNQIFVIPHGCITLDTHEKGELWNIFQTPYTLTQFGFGFFYKGVDTVLQAIHHLKKTDQKFKDIFYCYLCSDNPHTNAVHARYHEHLLETIKDLDLQDNAVIIRKYQTEQTINNYLRTAKIALFPYSSDPKNTVYGASGAIRIAMANEIPVIASGCHQFDDLEGVVPRPNNYLELAQEIDKMFSNDNHKKSVIKKSSKYIRENTWDITAERYLDTLQSIG